MPEVADAKAMRARSLTIPLNDEGDVLAIKWSPANLSQEVWEQMAALFDKAREDVSPFEAARVVAAPLMVWWDLTEGGEPYPITAENIAGFGLDFVLAVANAIQADFQIGKDVKKGSADGSSIQT